MKMNDGKNEGTEKPAPEAQYIKLIRVGGSVVVGAVIDTNCGPSTGVLLCCMGLEAAAQAYIGQFDGDEKAEAIRRVATVFESQCKTILAASIATHVATEAEGTRDEAHD